MQVKVKYVGLLDVFEDHLYNTGAWVKDTPREVEDYQALQLLRHPEFEDARHHTQRGKQIDAVIPEKADKDVEEDQLPSLQPLDAMTKAQLAVHAKRQFGVDIPTDLLKSEMVEKVRFLMGKPGVAK